MLAKLRNHLSPPVFDDAETSLNARNLNIILLTSIAGISITLIRFVALGKFQQAGLGIIFCVAGLLSLCSYLLLKFKHARVAGYIFVATFSILPLLLMVKGNGIHDTIALLLPIVIIVASMLFSAREMLAYTIVLALGFGGIARAEVTGRLVTEFSHKTTNSDVTDVFSILSVGALISTLLVTTLRRNYRRLGDALKEREASEEKYRLISSLSTDYVFSSTVLPNGQITHDWQSGAFASISGYTPDEFLAQGGWRATIHPDDLEIDDQFLEKIRLNQKVSGELRVITKSGETRWVREYVHPVWDEKENRLVGIYGAVQHISEQKWAEAKLRQQAEQMSALYDIGLAISSYLDLDQILQTLFKQCRQLFPVDTFYIAVFDEPSGTIRHPLFYDGNQKTFIQVADRNIEATPGLSGHVILSKETLCLPDSTDPAIQEKYNIVPTGSMPSRSYVGVPMLFHNTVVGVISMQNFEAGIYRPDQIRLLETIATQAAIAIENARLFESERSAFEQSETLRESAAIITATLNEKDAINKILEQLKRVVPYDSASVQLIEGNCLVIVGGEGIPPEHIGMSFIINEQEPSYPILQELKSYVLFHDIQETFQNFNVPPHNSMYSWLAVPLEVKRKIIGIIALDGLTPNQFTDQHAQLAVAFGNQVAIALENARLFSEVQQELSERKRAENTLRQRDEILQAVAHAAQVFLQSSNWRESINNVLQELGIATDASHVYIFENHTLADGTRVTSQRYEWNAPNSKPEIDDPQYQNVPLFGDGQQYWSGMLRNGQTVVGDLASLPKDEADYFQARGIKSILDVPIFMGGEWWGVIGFDDFINARIWSPAEIEALEIAAKMISAAIQRQVAEAAVRESERIYRQAIEAAGAIPYYRDYMKNKYEFMGTEVEKIIGYKPEEVTTELWTNIIKENIPLGEGEGLPIEEAVHHSRTGQFKIWRSDIRVIAKNGEEKWITDSAVELFDKAELSYASVGIMQDITDRKRTEAALRANEEKVRELNTSLEKRVLERTEQLQAEKARIEEVVNEIATLRRLSDFLQASMTIDEAIQIIVNHMNSLFPKTTGGLYLISDGFVDLSLVATWGGFIAEKVIQPNDCWGMRRGRMFARHVSDTAPVCIHFGNELARESLCLPLLAQNEMIGLLCIQDMPNGDNGSFGTDMQNLAVASSDSIALALANLRLRERLHNQSVSDPLTGLFNRRYMEETLAREVHRASRNQQPLCVIMFEVDDFRQYNNTFGHDAGDYVLRKVADTVRMNLRRSDFPCRYGGDEFTLLLPETTLEDGAHRAEELRKSVEVLALSYNNQALGQVTVRMGVSGYPKHGETGESVLKTADDASYRARAIGKNCVFVAE